MNGHFHVDGGVVVGLFFFLIFVIGMGFILLRAMPSGAFKSPGARAPTLPAPPPGSTPPPVSPAQQRTSKAIPWGTIFVVGLVVAALAYVFVNRPSFTDRPVTSSKIVKYQTASVGQRVSVGPSESELRAKARKERELIEGERKSLTFIYGDQLRWIKVPFGGYQTHFTVDDNKVVNMQCSSNSPEDEPPVDASGDQYECQDGITTNWVRFSPWDEDEGQVTVRYWFQYAL